MCQILINIYASNRWKFDAEYEYDNNELFLMHLNG